jgi:hypothetical protein
MATGFIGSSFALNTSGSALAIVQAPGSGLTAAVPIGVNVADGGVTYGFQLAYLWRYLGGEFISDFAPSFNMSSLVLAKNPTVNSYMFNVIGDGSWGWFHPFISGGIGAVNLRSQTFDQTAIPVVTVQGTLATQQNTINSSQSHFGTNIGGGLFLGAGQWGIRADARYYNVAGFSTNTLTNVNTNVPLLFTQSLLSDLHYWRANLGLSFRW